MHASATLVHNLKCHTDEVERLLFSPDGKTLAVSDEFFITLWDVETGSLRSKSEETDDMYFEIAFSPNSKYIAAASDEGHGRIWNTETGRLEHTLSVEDERMLSLAFSADSKMIATGSEVLRVWDVATGGLLHTLPAPGDHSLSFAAVYERNEWPAQICTVSFSPDNKWLISANPDTRMVCIWDTETWKLERTIREYTAFFSPDGKHLAVPTNERKSVQIYNTLTWQLQGTLENGETAIFPQVFSPDSKSFVTKSGRQTKLWSIENGEVIKTFTGAPPSGNHREECCTVFDRAQEVCKLAFSPDGKILMTGAELCSLRFWDVENEDLLLEVTHKDGARNPWNPQGFRNGPPAVEVLFGDGGGKVAIAFPDGSVRIWDVKWETT
ncbi:WD40 repeat-like protein, partial [Aureobasidium melanogenum]